MKPIKLQKKIIHLHYTSEPKSSMSTIILIFLPSKFHPPSLPWTTWILLPWKGFLLVGNHRSCMKWCCRWLLLLLFHPSPSSFSSSVFTFVVPSCLPLSVCVNVGAYAAETAVCSLLNVRLGIMLLSLDTLVVFTQLFFICQPQSPPPPLSTTQTWGGTPSPIKILYIYVIYYMHFIYVYIYIYICHNSNSQPHSYSGPFLVVFII